jgi:hypothetical protein
MGMLR